MKPPFAIYYAGDAYSTAQKIMGRQSAGRSFMAGVARQWPDGEIHGLGPERRSGIAMREQLLASGHRGSVRWSDLPSLSAATEIGTLYYPAPPSRDLAAARNAWDPFGCSLMGVTHTLSSWAAIDQLADLLLPPFQPWDALICTSQAAYTLVSSLHQDMRQYWQDTLGATRFVDVQLPVIPLGVDARALSCVGSERAKARSQLGLAEQDVAFLFAGRLSFHAKANPAPLYQALEAAAHGRSLVCVEAGVFPNEAIRHGFLQAQKALAPSVRFVWVDGADANAYRQAWQSADVFVSLSDNIQETFGLTPVEAMAAGLPVIVSDWNGYKDTVRHEVDGFRVATVTPAAPVGVDLASRHALGVDTYDLYIGMASLTTVVVPAALAQAVERLAADPALRASMGNSGRDRALTHFDWSVVLRQYESLAHELTSVRAAHRSKGGVSTPLWPQRRDPFDRFSHFPTTRFGGQWKVIAQPGIKSRLAEMLTLSMSNYAMATGTVSHQALESLADLISKNRMITVDDALSKAGCADPGGVRALVWLWKFDLVKVF